MSLVSREGPKPRRGAATPAHHVAEVCSVARSVPGVASETGRSVHDVLGCFCRAAKDMASLCSERQGHPRRSSPSSFLFLPRGEPGGGAEPGALESHKSEQETVTVTPPTLVAEGEGPVLEVKSEAGHLC